MEELHLSVPGRAPSPKLWYLTQPIMLRMVEHDHPSPTVAGNGVPIGCGFVLAALDVHASQAVWLAGA